MTKAVSANVRAFLIDHELFGLFSLNNSWSCCDSVIKSYLTLCDPMDGSTPCFPVLQDLGVCSNSCPLSWWRHPAISYSVVPFSSCLQSFPASWSFPVNQLFASDDQSAGASVSASVLPMNIQGWFPLRLTGLISLLSKGLSRVFYNLKPPILPRSAFFRVHLSHLYMTPEGKCAEKLCWGRLTCTHWGLF